MTSKYIEELFGNIEKLIKSKAFLSSLKKTRSAIKPWEFIKYLAESHIFIINKGAQDWVKAEKQHDRLEKMTLSELAEETSLPFEKTFFIFNPPLIQFQAHKRTPEFDRMARERGFIEDYTTMPGYAVNEVAIHALLCVETSPEKIKTYSLNTYLAQNIFGMGNNESIFTSGKDEAARMVCSMAEAISVMRVGVEHFPISVRDVKRMRNVKFANENIYHVAGKKEYEYIEPANKEGNIKWELSGFWRGHWRAFYLYKGTEKVKDGQGRNVVDWTKTGKNRHGEYGVKGYTWVVEHVKGELSKAQKRLHKVNPTEVVIDLDER